MLAGLVAGDALLSANTMAVAVGVPRTVQERGLTRQAAEEIFVSELARIAETPSGVPIPVPRITSRRTVVGALAEPLRLTELQGALQDLFGLEPVRVSAIMLEAPGGLSVELILTREGRQLRRFSVNERNGDPVALIRAAAQTAFEEIAPFRTTLARLRGALEGDGTDLAQVRADTRRLLGRAWRPDQDYERSALHSLTSVLALLDGDAVSAREEIERADSFEDALPTARAFYAANAAFLALLEGDAAAARREIERSRSFAEGMPIATFGAHLTTLEALAAWMDGRRDAAGLLLREALAADPRNRAARVYEAWLTVPPSGERALPAEVGSRSPLIPGLMASVFLIDPDRRTLRRNL